MIRMLQAGLMVLALLLAWSVVRAAPPPHGAADDEHPGAHHYIYYPTHRLYFSPDTQTWFWQDAGRWMSGGALPVPYQQYARGGYNVYLDVERPYDAQQDVEAGYRHHRWKPYHYGDDADGNPRANPRHGRGAGK